MIAFRRKPPWKTDRLRRAIALRATARSVRSGGATEQTARRANARRQSARRHQLSWNIEIVRNVASAAVSRQAPVTAFGSAVHRFPSSLVLLSPHIRCASELQSSDALALRPHVPPGCFLRESLGQASPRNVACAMSRRAGFPALLGCVRKNPFPLWASGAESSQVGNNKGPRRSRAFVRFVCESCGAAEKPLKNRAPQNHLHAGLSPAISRASSNARFCGQPCSCGERLW